MSMQIVGSRILLNRLDTPRGRGRSAALIAVTENGEAWLHVVRHTSHDGVRALAETVRRKGKINPEHWRQLDVAQLLLQPLGTLKLVDGTEVPGSQQLSSSQGSEDPALPKQAEPELVCVPRCNDGYALFPAEAQ